MARLISAGIWALAATLPIAAPAVPAGGMIRVAPVYVRPMAQRHVAGTQPEVFSVPFNVHPAVRLPTTFRVYTFRPTLLWNPSTCFANLTPWAGHAASGTQTDDLQSAGFTIGSLAGDPKHSMFNGAASDAASLNSQYRQTGGSVSSTFSMQYGVTPAMCGQTTLTGLTGL